MSSDRQLNYVNDLQNRDQKLYYVDDASELNSINLKENDKIYAINDNKLFQMEIVDQEEELSGSIVSFNGRNNTKIKSLVANIEPQQDLHGYGHPWPGGGGKNIFYLPVYSTEAYRPFITILNPSVNISEQTITLKCAGSGETVIERLFDFEAGSYAISFDVSKYTKRFVIFGYDENGNTLTQNDYSINGLTWNSFYKGYYGNENTAFIVPNTVHHFHIAIGVADDINGQLVTISQIQLEKGTTVTSYVPYENLCPISGWTGGGIAQTGKNLLAKPFVYFTDAPNDPQNCFFIKEGTYTFSFSNSTASNWRYGIRMFDLDGSYLSDDKYLPAQFMYWNMINNMWLSGGNTDQKSIILTIVKDCYIRIVFAIGDTTASTVFTDCQLERGSTATAYVPYTGNQISVTFPTTIYGGEDEVISGKLKSMMGIVDLGSLSWYYSSGRMIARIGDIKSPASNFTKANVICSMYPITTSANTEDPNYDKYLGVSRYGDICVRDSSYTDATIFKTAMLGVQLCYELAELVEYTLAGNEMTALYGTNNIWSNTGDITVKIAEKGITAFELAPHT